MNKKQKILTLAALAAFIGLILIAPRPGPNSLGAFGDSWISAEDLPRFTTPKVKRKVADGLTLTFGGGLNDSGIFLVMLAVVYTGLFFVLADKRIARSDDKSTKPTSTTNPP